MFDCRLLATLVLSYAFIPAAAASAAFLPPSRVEQTAAARTTSQIEKDLDRKTKSDVKSYFGRNPDNVESPTTWEFKGSFLDADSGKTFGTCRIGFSGDTCVMVRFY